MSSDALTEFISPVSDWTWAQTDNFHGKQHTQMNGPSSSAKYRCRPTHNIFEPLWR